MPNDWTVTSLLNMIATADPPYNALIDTGALITGMNNYQVAKYLLENGLPTMDGVVFLDENDAKMVLTRNGMKVIKLSQCGLAFDQRFSFYDQVTAALVQTLIWNQGIFWGGAKCLDFPATMLACRGTTDAIA